MIKTKSVPDEARLIGRNLRQLRKIQKLTQNDMAVFLGVSYQQIQKYESGQNRLPIDHLYRIKNFFDVPFEYFFVGFKNHQIKKIAPALKTKNFYRRCLNHYINKASYHDHLTHDDICRIIGTLI